MFRPADVFSTGIVPIRQMSCFPPARPLETGGCAPSPSCLAADRLPGRGKTLWDALLGVQIGLGACLQLQMGQRRVGTRPPRRLVARLSAARIHGPPGPVELPGVDAPFV